MLAIGRWLNQRVAILRDFNIPEPVTRGLLAAGRRPWFHRDRSRLQPGNP
ncbi:MAG: hypothetical protein N3Z28_04250 [Synechococcaceae cyanobacterium MAG-AL2]|nr:sodium/glutamate symporter [Synechococcus sp. Ace-Pa]MCT4366866.1 hypothetical protein [Candidatus Regnicoccus frigidus MAG-AL2]